MALTALSFTGLRGIDEWKNRFGNPTGALLGITSAAYALGAIASTFFLCRHIRPLRPAMGHLLSAASS